jgi:hypothetical protein
MEVDATSLATFDNYRLPRKNDSYHLVILHGHLWGGRFQMVVIRKGRVTGGNGMKPSGRKGLIWFGDRRVLAL